MGYAYLKLGNLDKAIENLKLAIKINDKNGDACYNLSLCYYK